MTLAFLVFGHSFAQASPFQVAITFDDLPVAGDMPSGIDRDMIAKSIIGTLKEHNVPSPYGFVNGAHVKNLPELISVLQSWWEAGFPLGNRGFNHLDFATTSLANFISNATANESLLRDIMCNMVELAGQIC
ncbi:MAG: polysaccharide deacetylase family protein [Aestuariivirga sp.]